MTIKMTFREVMKKLGMWTSVQRETYKVLSRMTDHELRDIGLCRGDINRLVEEMEGGCDND
jgi:uncharacterized protein YjiS (DUF1127 family)